ncbi:MAG: phosphatidylcholine/phosphatidylserine synthase [Sphingomonadaceae bacterium]|nr:phosphatidylcholine/phosphatidylserine synthase [Sphingomonadaceae bacterium]
MRHGAWSDTPFRTPDEERRPRRGIPLRAVAPNAVTALALCFGLSSVRFALMSKWELAVTSILFAGILDGLDGRIARLLRAQSRFGAELDSLSDVVAFGVSPAVVIYLWSLQYLPQFGWTIALAHAVCCALRLARFNANIDVDEQPHKSAGFLTGVPAPAGAMLALLPLYLWLSTGLNLFRNPYGIAPWSLFVAMLMISNVASFSWSALRLRQGVRLWALAAIALLGSALISTPWTTLSILCAGYVVSIPFGVRSYARVRRLRAVAADGSVRDSATAATPA